MHDIALVLAAILLTAESAATSVGSTAPVLADLGLLRVRATAILGAAVVDAILCLAAMRGLALAAAT